MTDEPAKAEATRSSVIVLSGVSRRSQRTVASVVSSRALVSAAVHLSSKGYRSDRIARVGAQFSQAIRGSFP